MTPIYLAMMWRNPDGSLTIAFWYAALVSTVMIAAGIWCLLAPESMRFHYFNVINSYRARAIAPDEAWGWSSPIQIRLGGLLAIVLGAAFMTWIVFFTTPGVTY
jgi:hypothetical protein